MEEEKEQINKIIDEGGKVIDKIIYEKDKVTTTRKIEPVNGEATSSTIVQSKETISINCL